MASFLGDIAGVPAPHAYHTLGYSRNPFPPRGSVRTEVYLDRPELAELRKSLVKFILGGDGRFWAVQGEPGYGKSNFLGHLEWDLGRRQASGMLPKLALRYVPTQQVAPRYLTQQILEGIGENRLNTLMSKASMKDVPDSMRDTDFGHFFAAVETERESACESDESAESLSVQAAQFFIRWVGGNQTYVVERNRLGADPLVRCEFS